MKSGWKIRRKVEASRRKPTSAAIRAIRCSDAKRSLLDYDTCLPPDTDGPRAHAEVQTMSRHRQFTLTYLFAETALIAVAIAAARLALLGSGSGIELQTLNMCLAATAACGALGGLCLRMALGLIAGSILSLTAVPSLCLILA